jgi:hypothetical protein
MSRPGGAVERHAHAGMTVEAAFSSFNNLIKIA